jgi:hypothetical protein
MHEMMEEVFVEARGKKAKKILKEILRIGILAILWTIVGALSLLTVSSMVVFVINLFL